MRIKADFVTNSSTTSFVVWGISLDFEEIFENQKLMEMVFHKFDMDGKNTDNLSFEQFVNGFKEGDFSKYDIMEYIDNNVKKPLECSFGYDGDYFMIGGSPNLMGDDETLGDYKKEIIEKLNELGFDVKKLEYIEEAWRD